MQIAVVARIVAAATPVSRIVCSSVIVPPIRNNAISDLTSDQQDYRRTKCPNAPAWGLQKGLENGQAFGLSRRGKSATGGLTRCPGLIPSPYGARDARSFTESRSTSFADMVGRN